MAVYPIPVARCVCTTRPMDGSLLTFLSLGFGLGLVHALDADHVIAVRTLASRRPGLREWVHARTADRHRTGLDRAGDLPGLEPLKF